MTADDDRVACPQCGLEVLATAKVCPADGTQLVTPASSRNSGAELTADSQVGEYLVRGVVGAGGMGVVYEGVHPVIGKRVAIKVLKPGVANVPSEAARLVSEARLVNAIGHRGIIDIFSLGRLADGRQYLVMELLQGASLHAYIKEWAPMGVPEVLQILDEIAAALSAAHGAGVTHRDLKPNNIFIVNQPDGSRYVKLLDFGLAKQAPFRHGESPQTRVSRVIGTPQFMAPEQARGQPVGPRTDLYALGVVAFEMLTGRLPFTGRLAWEVVNHHLNTPAPAPSTLAGGIPEPLDALVLHLLQKDAALRPSSAEAVRSELKKLRKQLELSETRLEHVISDRPGAPPAVPRLEGGRPTQEAPRSPTEPEHPLAAAADPTRIDAPAAALTLDDATPVPPPLLEASTSEPHADAPVTADTTTSPTVAKAPSSNRSVALAVAFLLSALGVVGAAFLLEAAGRPAGRETLAAPGRDLAASTAGRELPVKPELPTEPAPVESAGRAVAPQSSPSTDGPSPEGPLKPNSGGVAANLEVAPEPAGPKGHGTGPRPSGLNATRAALLARIEQLERRSASGQLTPVARMLLTDAKAQINDARNSKQLHEAELYLDDWERKFGAKK